MQPVQRRSFIVVVEDHLPDVLLIKEALLRAGIVFELQHYSDGEQACSAFEQATPERLPDLIILDLNLPRISGFDLLAAIRSDERLRDTRVVILTSSRLTQDHELAVRLKADVFITKPQDLNEFLRIVAARIAPLLRRQPESHSSHHRKRAVEGGQSMRPRTGRTPHRRKYRG